MPEKNNSTNGMSHHTECIKKSISGFMDILKADYFGVLKILI
jgi:hypothetical protein